MPTHRPRDSTKVIALFAKRLVAWQKVHGRHHLPWQVADPYRIWLSEIMLQQTQVGTVLPYYTRFIEHFPDVASLAKASLDNVLTLWSGLGYYSRARSLHRTAQIIVDNYKGCFPTQRTTLETLPGIGRSTAAAIAVFAAQQQEAILDGNVKRVLARIFGIESPLSHPQTQHQLWRLAEQLLPSKPSDMIPYTQGLMDLGATICKRTQPTCAACPMHTLCVAKRHHKITSIPAKPPKLALPVRHTIMLLLCHQAAVYLEKRPLQGIWQGLWTLPTVDTPSAVKAMIHPWATDPLGPAESIVKHTFTHFRLIITPQVVRLHTRPDPSEALPGQWFTQEACEKIAMPTPVRQLVARLPAILATHNGT